MSSTVRIRYLGHATLLLQLDGLRILTDPLLRPVLGPLVRIGPAPEPAAYRDIDLVLVSHLHPDHLDIGSLRLLGGRPTLVVPKGAGSLLAHTHHRAVV
jgi:L-ascorbate metabolism protein UlaG (beta-lactamase superfamily)